MSECVYVCVCICMCCVMFTYITGDMDDVWIFNKTQYKWIWVGGTSSLNSVGIPPSSSSPQYGTYGGGMPGARYAATRWVDLAGRLWVYAGSNGVYCMYREEGVCGLQER